MGPTVDPKGLGLRVRVKGLEFRVKPPPLIGIIIRILILRPLKGRLFFIISHGSTLLQIPEISLWYVVWVLLGS